jgi:hypothetical protein
MMRYTYHSSSRRTPGPITTNVRGYDGLDLQRVATIKFGGYGSPLPVRNCALGGDDDGKSN